MRLWLTVLALPGIHHCVLAAEIVVTSPGDRGARTLRAAIELANANGEPDTIRFGAQLVGARIRPATPLPSLMEGATVVNGDVTGDGMPDISLSGSRISGRYAIGLWCQSSGNVITRLIIRDFSLAQVLIDHADRNTIRGCRIGTNAAGTAAALRGDGI